MVIAAVPALMDLAAKPHLNRLFGMALEPDLSAGQPIIHQLLLPAVNDLLAEDTVLIEDGIAGAGRPMVAIPSR